MKFIELSKIKGIIKSGSTIAVGGFTINRKPIAAIKQIADSDADNLSIFTLAGSLDVDLLLKSNKLKKIMAAYVGYEGLGLSHFVRKNVESGNVEFEDLTEILYYYRLKAAAENKDSLITEAITYTDIVKINSACEVISDIKTGTSVTQIKALHPDICLIHAHKVDSKGNVYIADADFSEKEMAKASKITVVTVEEQDEIPEITISAEDIDYIVVLPGSAKPTECMPNYAADIPKIMELMKND